ncbi:MAG: long-chain-fatty-acid--CoA ligase [Sphingomonadales bacterium]|nr:long-chain-fatty-acid--CoA ligase [Sphingomonadales bacterium]
MTSPAAPLFTHLSQVAPAKAAQLGAKPALSGPGGITTYADLARQVEQARAALCAAGVRPGDRLAFLSRNDPAYYALLLAAGAAGAVVVPVNWRLAPPEIEYILADCGAVLLFAGAEFVAAGEALAALRAVVPMADFAAWCAAAPAGADNGYRPDPDDVAAQIYTSGTTGRPKGAMLTHRALLAFRSLPVAAQPAWNRWTDDDVSLIVMPQFHIGGTGFGLQTLCAGATGLVMQDFDAGAVLAAIEHERLSKIFTVPAAMQMLLRHPRARAVDYSRIHTIIYGASPIPLDLLREAMAVFGCGFVQQYGMTEMCGTICALPPEDHDPAGNDRMRSAGKPLDGVTLRILDPAGRALPPGEVGEVAIGSVTRMAGYWNLPEATAEALTPDGLFRSGDAGWLDADGYLTIVDRVKDMIVSGGENVYPAEVEAVLRRHPAVAEVAVIGVPDARWGEAVKAVIVPAGAVDPAAPPAELAAAIIAWARGELAGYKLPKTIDLVAALPRNAAGKVLRRELRAPYWEGRERAIN